jgi:hypothetical protein
MNCGEGAVFYCEELGAVLLKKQKEEIFTSEGSSVVLDMLGDEGFRRLVRRLFEEKYNSMTIGSVAKNAVLRIRCRKKISEITA